MRIVRGLLLAASACLVLASCGKKEPTGQVVATLKGKEVTAAELRNELSGFQAPNPQVRKQAEQQALDQILTRKALSQAAEKAGVGKTPEFALQEKRLHEALLVQTWQQQVSKLVPEPSRVEADKFIAEHPDMYAQRKVWLVEQVRFPRPSDPNLINQMRPLNTLEDLVAFLNANRIPSRAGGEQIDALAIDPKVTDQIVKLAPGEVFLIPNGNLLVANRIRETRVAPVTGEPAVKHATNYLKGVRTQEAVQRQFGAVVAAARKDVKYAKAYQPKPPPKAPAAAPAAAAPAAATPAAAAPAAAAPAAAAPAAPAAK